MCKCLHLLRQGHIKLPGSKKSQLSRASVRLRWNAIEAPNKCQSVQSLCVSSLLELHAELVYDGILLWSSMPWVTAQICEGSCWEVVVIVLGIKRQFASGCSHCEKVVVSRGAWWFVVICSERRRLKLSGSLRLRSSFEPPLSGQPRVVQME